MANVYYAAGIAVDAAILTSGVVYLLIQRCLRGVDGREGGPA